MQRNEASEGPISNTTPTIEGKPLAAPRWRVRSPETVELDIALGFLNRRPRFTVLRRKR